MTNQNKIKQIKQNKNNKKKTRQRKSKRKNTKQRTITFNKTIKNPLNIH